jgi:hypothetical protein
MNNQDAVIEQTQGFEMSQKYSPIRTRDVINNLINEGYVVNQVSKSKVRKKTKDGFQKHLLRISHNDLDLGIEGLRPEIILINSYDGSTSFQLLVGVFRFACANGLIVGNSYFNRSIRHVGDVLPKVLNAVTDVKYALPMVAEDIQRFSQRVLTQIEKEQFATDVAKNVISKNTIPVDVTALLTVNRPEDRGNDLFTVLNVVQENILQGILKVQSTNDVSKVQPIRKMRKIKSLTRSTEINQLIWDKANELIAA